MVGVFPQGSHLSQVIGKVLSGTFIWWCYYQRRCGWLDGWFPVIFQSNCPGTIQIWFEVAHLVSLWYWLPAEPAC